MKKKNLDDLDFGEDRKPENNLKKDKNRIFKDLKKKTENQRKLRRYTEEKIRNSLFPICLKERSTIMIWTVI